MRNEYFNTLLFYSDDKLIKIITTDRDEFIPEVVEIAEHLLKSRGYEIEFEGEKEEDVQVHNLSEEFESIQTEVMNDNEESSETLWTIALLFGAIIFGLFGLIAFFILLHGREDEIVGVMMCFGLSILCIFSRRKIKNQSTNHHS